MHRIEIPPKQNLKRFKYTGMSTNIVNLSFVDSDYRRSTRSNVQQLHSFQVNTHVDYNFHKEFQNGKYLMPSIIQINFQRPIPCSHTILYTAARKSRFNGYS